MIGAAATVMPLVTMLTPEAAGALAPLMKPTLKSSNVAKVFVKVMVYLPALFLTIEEIPIPVLETMVGAPEAPMLTCAKMLTGWPAKLY